MGVTSRRTGTVVGPQGIPGLSGPPGAAGGLGPAGPAGASGGLTYLTSSFTMPAVGSTVSGVGVTTGTGVGFQKYNAINISVSGSPSNMTITAVSGDSLTLLNNGGPYNVTPGGTVPSSSAVSLASINGPLAALAPSVGQALVLQSNGYTSAGVPQRLLADSYFVSTDPDDTNCINRMFAAAYALQVASGVSPIMSFLPRNYSVSGTLQCIGASGSSFVPFIEGGSTSISSVGTSITANSSFPLGGFNGSTFVNWTPLLLVQWCQSGRIEKLDLNGGGRALAAAQQKAYSSGVVWDACTFVTPVSFNTQTTITNVTLASTTYTVTSPAHGLVTGNTVSIVGVNFTGSAVGPNGAAQTITKVDANTYTVVCTGAGSFSYSSGGETVVTTRQTSHAYTKGQAVLSDVLVQGLPDNTHLYIATTAGTTGSGAVVWPASAGGTVVDGGVTWQEFGPSPAAFLQGDTVAATGGVNQAADTRWNDCQFAGAAVGWRSLLTSSNTKDFILSHCFFIGCTAIGCDMVSSAGFVALTAGTEFAANGWDVRTGDGINLELGQGWSSEGSSGFVTGNIGGFGNTQLRIGPGYWQGVSFGGPGTPCMNFGGRLDMSGVYIVDGNVNNQHPYIYVGNVNGAVTSHNNIFGVNGYAGPYFAPYYDTGGNGLVPGGPSYYPGYGILSLAITSVNDSMFDGSTNHPLPNLSGTPLSSTRTQLPVQPGGNVSAVTWTTLGQGTKATAKCSIPYTLMQALATAQSSPDACTVTIAVPWNKVKIEAFDFSVTQSFTGLGGGVTLTMSGGNVVQVGGTATPAAYLAATSLLGATGALVQGAGASIGAWVWGPASGAPTNADMWNLTATIACSAALSGLSNGSVDIYIDLENRSGL